jgi:hypothetical protein
VAKRQKKHTHQRPRPTIAARPTEIDELLLILLKGFRRAMHPLTHRRKVQDLFDALLRPWVGRSFASDRAPI